MQFNDHLIDLPSLHQVIDCYPLTISPDSHVSEAINLMNQAENHIHNINNTSRSLLGNKQQKKVTSYVLIVQQRQLLGIFTLADVLKLTALNIDLAKTTMAEVMTQQVMTLKLSDLDHISTVLYFLQQYSVPHLPIVDDEGNLVGIINESSLLHELDVVKVVGIVEAVNQTLTNVTNQSPENYQQREKVSGNTDNLLKTWIEEKIAKEIQINEELQQTLEELQIIEEELRQQNEQLATAREITELERRRYQDLFEFTPDGFLVTDKLGVIQEANHAASSLLCVHQKYLVGKPITIFLGQLDRQNVLSHLSSSQHFQEWKIDIQPREGQPFPASIRVRAVYDRQGQWRGWCWLICNISVQKQAEEVLRQSSDELEQRVAERTRELIVANQALEQEIKERQETQAALQKSEETFRQFGENLDAYIWICSQDCSTLFYINPAYEKIWGRSCQSLWGNPLSWIEAVHPEDLERMMAEVEEQHQKGGNISVEYRIIRSDGSIRWLCSRRFPIKNEQGQVEYYGGIGEDITERKQAEAALQKSEETFRQFGENIQTQIIWIKSYDRGETVYVNPAYEKIWGRTCQSLRENPQSWIEAIHPEDRDRILAETRQNLQKGEACNLEYRIIKPDGSIGWISARAFPIKNEQGEIQYFGGVAEDISERKLAEAAVRQSEYKFRQFADNFQSVVWIAAANCTEDLYVNPAYEKVWGRSRASMGNNPKSWLEGVHPEDRDRVIAQMQSQMHSESGILEYRVLRPDGSIRWVWARRFMIKNEQGEIEYFGGIAEDITERKQTEAELKKTENKFRYFTENSDTLIWMASKDSKETLYINPAYEKIWGRSCQSLRENPQSWTEAIHPEDRDRILAEIAERHQKGEGANLEYRILQPNGTVRWIWGRCFPIKNEQGELDYYGSLTEDITERKLAEESLRDSETRLTLALETANMGIWDWNMITNHCLWSDHVGPLYGLPKGSLCPPDYDDFSQFIHPEDRDILQQNLNQSISQGSDFAVEYRAVWPDGSLHWLRGTGKVYHNQEGQPIRMIGTTRDISERKETEHQLYEQAALLDIATDAIFVRDFQTEILFWNQGAERMYGWQKHEALGKNLKDLFCSKTAQQQEATALRTVVKSGIWQGELRKKTKFGTEIIVESRWTLMFDADDQPKSILVVDSDITEKKQLEEQFFRTQRLESIGTLAGGIAHDLNNILTPILGAAQLLKGRFAKNEERHPQLLEIIENNAQRGAALVKQVLSFARGLKGEKGIVQIKHLIAEIIQIGKQTFPKSIEFTTQIPEDLWTVSGDTTQLHQVLMNLVVNARDAMPEGGTLTIITENIYIDEAYTRMLIESKIGNYIVITVTDTGVGMTKEVLDRIFEPFFTTKEFKGGTGLGLSTAVGIIKSHNGFMTVNSQVGKGSTFKVFLPSVESPQVPDIDQSKIPLGQGELILVVDDEPQIRDVATIILENHNYQTLTASNGVEAIALYAQYKKNISAVLMDMMMPEMDGITAIRTLKKMNPKVQVIACSGLNTKDVFPESAEMEMQSVLFKPYTANELLRSLNQIIHNL
ncbi:PAS domain-containing protein [Anabaena azotica]|uniref:PAS domain-containing protein n=1 Tax=Anabaena azotica TaxID=197653 RepID=UPI0039A423E5